jgi:hypothetical protein
VACWPSASSTVLCLTQPWTHELQRYAAFGVGPATAPASPLPLTLVLADGTHCQVRSGGAWSPLAGHPGWTGWYWCDGNGAVWGAAGSNGIDRSSARWSVEFGSISGNGPVHEEPVTTALFAGTAG